MLASLLQWYLQRRDQEFCDAISWKALLLRVYQSLAAIWVSPSKSQEASIAI